MTGRFAPSAKGRSIPGRTGVMIDWADYLAVSAHDVEGGGPRISEPNWQLPQRTTGERGHQVMPGRTSAGFQGMQVPAAAMAR